MTLATELTEASDLMLKKALHGVYAAIIAGVLTLILVAVLKWFIYAVIRKIKHGYKRSMDVPKSIPIKKNRVSCQLDHESGPHCPVCNREMVARQARRGPNAGNSFWGCPAYPDCRGTREIEETS